MDWLRENWLWLAIAVGFFWMHAKMHGGHGRHGSHSGHGGHGGCCGPSHGEHTHEEAGQGDGDEHNARH
ncbi:MAG: DUF2933 domain-containing protein [Gemmatimonadales bacterium]|nr:DUF2933 domain-containing protein [Gemmatimonadales bacterium]NIN12065.1 DUF2933 domain-containing protein [Gemmatimonadales bacterium]NIR03300.1 DUF2933 domain-containing protein [Gemmatimonadales bacterium]NIS66980.1 DUF2933 domain-containing protein [Gemmatimonadales bacterium]